MLTALQVEIAGLLSQLPEADTFVLAGGGALIARGLVDRSTRDLDYFATSPAAVERLLPALEERLRHHGLTVTRKRDVPGFVRLEISSSDGETVEVDLSHDARMYPAETTDLGPTLSVDELAADKMLALYGRAEARDFIDVAALLATYPATRLLELAASKDRGFTIERFRESLAAIHRLRAEDFAVDPDQVDTLRSRFDAWRDELATTRDAPQRPGK